MDMVKPKKKLGQHFLKDQNIAHGPVEVLLTVDEETGMTGAFELMLAFYFGSKVMHHFAATYKRKTSLRRLCQESHQPLKP